MEMFNPPHPGEIIREDCLAPLGLSVTEAAKGLDVSRGHLSDLLNGHSCISAEMALRSKGQGGGVRNRGCAISLTMTCGKLSSVRT
jgi:antitoxin HigA-1